MILWGIFKVLWGLASHKVVGLGFNEVVYKSRVNSSANVEGIGCRV